MNPLGGNFRNPATARAEQLFIFSADLLSGTDRARHRFFHRQRFTANHAKVAKANPVRVFGVFRGSPFSNP